MKLYAALLALCAVQGTAAFAPQASKPVAFSGRTSLGVGAVPDGEAKLSERAGGPETNKPGATGKGSLASAGQTSGMQQVKDIWDTLSPITVQGGSLRTWSFESASTLR